MLNPFNQVPNFSKLLRPRESKDTVTVLLVNACDNENSELYHRRRERQRQRQRQRHKLRI